MAWQAEAILTTRLSETAANWFKQALHKVRARGEATDAFLIMWTGAGRRLGQAPIESPTDAERAGAFFPQGWPTDEYGRVFGHPGLHIADGSVMPGAVGANPSLTIAALANRFADAILDGPAPRLFRDSRWRDAARLVLSRGLWPLPDPAPLGRSALRGGT